MVSRLSTANVATSRAAQGIEAGFGTPLPMTVVTPSTFSPSSLYQWPPLRTIDTTRHTSHVRMMFLAQSWPASVPSHSRFMPPLRCGALEWTTTPVNSMRPRAGHAVEEGADAVLLGVGCVGAVEGDVAVGGEVIGGETDTGGDEVRHTPLEAYATFPVLTPSTSCRRIFRSRWIGSSTVLRIRTTFGLKATSIRSGWGAMTFADLVDGDLGQQCPVRRSLLHRQFNYRVVAVDQHGDR